MHDMSVSGVWWLPDIGDRVQGTMEYSRSEGIQLELVRSLRETFGPLELRTYPVLYGLTNTEHKVTLGTCRCVRGPGIVPSSGAPESYAADVAFLGAHFLDPGCQRFARFTFELDDLYDWVGVTATHPAIDRNVSTGKYSASITYSPPPEPNFSTKLGLFSVRHGFKTGTEEQSKTYIRHEVKCDFQPSGSMTLKEFTEHVGRPIQDLLTLSVGRPNAFSQLEAAVSDGENEITWTNVLFQQLSSHPARRSPVYTPEMLLSFADLVERGASALDRWFDLASEIHTVRTLLTGIQYRPEMFLDQKFLYAAHALETFHRQIVGGTELTQECHSERLTAILAAVPSIHKTWLEGKLDYSNELTLGQRVRALLTLVSQPVLEVVGNPKRFVRSMLDTRNYFTHHDPRLTSRAAKGEQLLWLTQCTVLLVADLLLREMGFDSDKRARMIVRTQAYELPKLLLARANAGGGSRPA